MKSGKKLCFIKFFRRIDLKLESHFSAQESDFGKTKFITHFCSDKPQKYRTSTAESPTHSLAKVALNMTVCSELSFSFCQVIHAYKAQREDELDLIQGDILRILPIAAPENADSSVMEDHNDNAWSQGISPQFTVGWFPFKTHTRTISPDAIPEEKRWDWVILPSWIIKDAQN